MKYYCIKIGKTYNEVQTNKFLWAPVPYKNSKDTLINNSGWRPLGMVNKGDVAFLFKDGVISQIGIASADSYSSLRPATRDFDEWKNEGNRVDVELIQLNDLVDFKMCSEEFHQKFSDTCQPMLLDKNKVLTETYANLISRNAGEYLLSKLSVDDEASVTAKSLPTLQTDYPVKSSFSWEVISNQLAKKICDKTIVKDFETDIPKDLVQFFLDRSLDPGEQSTIKAYCCGQQVELPINKKQNGRCNISLREVSSRLKLSELKVSRDSVFFERDSLEPGTYHLSTKSKSRKIAIKPKQRKKPNGTSSLRISEGRIGQDYFREEVIGVCKGKCAVTGVKEQCPSILIASHIKGWVDSNDDEKMDGHNGLLLAPHIDKLFDKHLITFDKVGFLKISKNLARTILDTWNINISKPYTLTKKNNEFMAFHRDEFERKEIERASSSLLTKNN
jgi:hypothetical protein